MSLRPKVLLSDYYKIPSIDSALPLKFSTGGAIFTLNGVCPDCGMKASGERLRGYLRPWHFGTDETPGSVYRLDARGHCPGCDVVYTVDVIMRSTHWEGLDPKSGRWGVWLWNWEDKLWYMFWNFIHIVISFFFPRKEK